MPLLLAITVLNISSASSKSSGNSLNSTDFFFKDVTVKHLSWDEIETQFSIFHQTQKLTSPIQKVTLKIFNSKGNLLAQSFKPTIKFNDALLESEENLQLEITATIHKTTIKHVESIKSSKKKITIEHKIFYPLKKQLFAGICQATPQLLRVKFNQKESWEKIYTPKKDWNFYLTIQEENSAKKIAIPINIGTNKFNLRNAPQYETILPEIENAITQNGEAALKFNVIAFKHGKTYTTQQETIALAYNNTPNLNKEKLPTKNIAAPAGNSTSLTTITLGSQNDLQKFVKVWASNQIKHYYITPAALKISLHTWAYNTATGKYIANVTIQWQNQIIPEEKYILRGNFQISTTGINPTFTRTFANTTILDIEKYQSERAMK